ncbi:MULTISPECIES: LutC/YkgG family protein [Gammaproteobacteria]|uniref:LutC/YkgG family protein n=1 Tax=Gammaproteobacteria TaxID=1236 RepID=UPI003A93927E
MSEAKNRILARLRQVNPSAPERPEQPYAPYLGEDAPARLARFCSRLEAAHAEVVRCPQQSLAAQLQAMVKGASLTRLLAGNDGPFSAAISQACGSRLSCFDKPMSEFKAVLFTDVDAGISQAWGAIADTGTLVLWTGPNEPRSLSLVPPVSIIIVAASAIMDNFAQLLAKPQCRQGLPTNLLLVSGPSKTADIQQTLAYGAHGPRQLYVVVVEDC